MRTDTTDRDHQEPPRLTRRRLLLGALAGAQAVGILSVTRNQWRLAYERDFAGFEPLDPAAFHELVLSHTEMPVRLAWDELADDGGRRFRFSLPEASAIYLSATTGSAGVPFVHPLIVQLEYGRRYLLPLIRSSRDGNRIPSAVNLGRFDAGDHTFTLRQDPAVSLPILASVRLGATRPDPDSLLAAFMDHNPVVKLKNLSKVLDDIPLVSFCKIHKRGARYRVTSYIIFSSENGGTMPVSLMAAYQRTVDIEWVMEQLFESTGDVIAARRRFQRRHHGTEPFAGREMFGNSPVLDTATPNNNFADGRIRLWRWTFSNPFATRIDDPIYYSPKPVFLAPHEWAADMLLAMPELQQWSLFEVALEGCVDLADRDDPAVAAFAADLEAVSQYLHVSYPSRGCQLKLQVPLEPPEPSTAPMPRSAEQG
ncbi:MAG: hypothetical protein ACRDJH_23455 [Thermomicrobiales bacterium]